MRTMKLMHYPLLVPLVFLFGSMLPHNSASAERRIPLVHMSLKEMYPDKRIQALVKAADRGDVDRMLRLVGQGVDVNYRGAHGAPPLYWLYRRANNVQGFTRLLELGADPNVVFVNTTMLHMAVIYYDTEFLRRMLEHGGNPNIAAPSFGGSLFSKAVMLRNKAAMRVLLEAGADIDYRGDASKAQGHLGGGTPILGAAASGSYDIVLELLQLGADYLAKDANGQDLMFWVEYHRDRGSLDARRGLELDRVIDWLVEHQMELQE